MGIVHLGSLHILIEYLLVVLMILFDSSWFSPLHLLIIEYVAPISVIAALFILLLNTAQVFPS